MPKESASNGGELSPRSAPTASPSGRLPARQLEHLKPRLWLMCVGTSLIAVATILKVAPSEPGALSWRDPLREVGAHFLGEMGVAMIVAFFVALTIERQAKLQETNLRLLQEWEAEERRTRQEADAEERRSRRELEAQERQKTREEEAEARRVSDALRIETERKLIAEDVVAGVFGIQLPARYVRTVIESNLQVSIARSRVTLFHSILPLSSAEEEAMGVSANRLVVLDMIATFTFRNLSSGERPVDVRCGIPIRNGAGFRAASRVYEVSIGGESLTPDQIRAGLTSADSDSQKTYCWPRTMEGRTDLPVVIRGRSIKERSDSEAWASYFPTIEGLTLTVQALPDMLIGVTCRTASKCVERIKPSPESLVGVWEINGPILPNESVVFWWRDSRDEGAPAHTRATAERDGDECL